MLLKISVPLFPDDLVLHQSGLIQMVLATDQQYQLQLLDVPSTSSNVI